MAPDLRPSLERKFRWIDLYPVAPFFMLTETLTKRPPSAGSLPMDMVRPGRLVTWSGIAVQRIRKESVCPGAPGAAWAALTSVTVAAVEKSMRSLSSMSSICAISRPGRMPVTSWVAYGTTR